MEGQTMPLLDINGLTDTKGVRKKQKKLQYVAINGKTYKSEAEYVRMERKGE